MQIVNGPLQVGKGTSDSGGERDLNIWWSIMEIVVLIRDGDDGWSREMCIETHICTSVQLGSLNCVRVREKGSRGPSCEGGLSRGCSRPKFLGPRGRKMEGC